MPTDQLLLLTLVLVAAIAAGWLLRGWQSRKGTDAGARAMSDDYFRGLNFLLNEEPDKAVEVFIRMIEVDSETVETHFALASLFRRRGEVDRAIRIHQNLIARPNLSRTHRQQALYELGDDYMRAGLFDRAESLFLELSQSGPYVVPALRQLQGIYEQQRDWEQAVTVAQRLELVVGRPQQRVISHYWCELAEAAANEGQPRRAAQLARKAQGADPSSPRTGMLNGELLEDAGDVAAALRAYQGVIEHDPAFAGEVLVPVHRCFSKLGDRDGFDAFLARLHTARSAAAPYIAIAAFHEPTLRSKALVPFVSQFLETRGRGLAKLLERLSDQRPTEGSTEDSAREMVRLLLEDQPRYQCTDCGLATNTLYWQCPGCRAWSSVKPRVELPYVPSASALPEGTVRR